MQRFSLESYLLNFQQDTKEKNNNILENNNKGSIEKLGMML